MSIAATHEEQHGGKRCMHVIRNYGAPADRKITDVINNVRKYYLHFPLC